jgi:hypothetical protein
VNLTLRFHGVRTPSSELTEKFNNSVAARIDGLAVDSIYVHLSRNKQFKLTPSDVAYLQPPDTPPSQYVAVRFPAAISTSARFCRIARRNLLLHFDPLCLQTPPPNDVENCLSFIYNPPPLPVAAPKNRLLVASLAQGRGLGVLRLELAGAEEGGVVVPAWKSLRTEPAEGGGVKSDTALLSVWSRGEARAAAIVETAVTGRGGGG